MLSFRTVAGLAAGALTFLAACSDSTAPGTAVTQFGEPLSLAQFETEVVGTARVEIEFATLAGLVAREIEVEPDDAEEKFVSRVTSMNTTAGTLTLELGGFVVTYGASTRFRTPANSNVSRTAWESQIAAELNAGRQPSIEARRNQPATPQAPTLATFTATDLRLTAAIEKAKLEVYVDADNFTDVASPPPLAILRVFNLPVQILSSTRIQRILNGAPPQGTSVQFEAQVASVNTSAGSLTLLDGTVILVGAGTTFDPQGDVLTLSAAASAVASRDVVRIEGIGTVQSSGPPRTIAATSVKIEVDN